MLHQIDIGKISRTVGVFQQVENWSFHVVDSKGRATKSNRKGISLINTSSRARTVQLAKTYVITHPLTLARVFSDRQLMSRNA